MHAPARTSSRQTPPGATHENKSGPQSGGSILRPYCRNSSREQDAPATFVLRRSTDDFCAFCNDGVGAALRRDGMRTAFIAAKSRSYIQTFNLVKYAD
jgi:hypothetical protein